MGTFVCLSEILESLDVIQKYIRGAGLAYGANTGFSFESGILSLSLYRVSVTDMVSLCCI